MDELTVSLGITACVISIVGLSWFIHRKLRVIKNHKLAQELNTKEQSDKKQHLVESLSVLAKTMIDGQLEFSEGCIRIKVLIDHFDASLHERDEFKIFEKMYAATEHMPTHEERKKVDVRFIEKMDKQCHELEQEHSEEILKASKALLSYL